MLHLLCLQMQQQTHHHLHRLIPDPELGFIVLHDLLAELENGLQVRSHPPSEGFEGIAEILQVHVSYFFEAVLNLFACLAQQEGNDVGCLQVGEGLIFHADAIPASEESRGLYSRFVS